MEIVNKIIAFFQSETLVVVGGFILLCIEYWLGKTNLVKPGSTLEAVFKGIVKVLEILKIKKPAG